MRDRTLALALASTLLTGSAAAQNPLPAGIPALTMNASSATGSWMTVAYHPSFNQWYGFRGGNPTFPYDVYDANGAVLFTSTSVGVDGRSMFYNPNTSNLEVVSFNAVSGGGAYGFFTVGLDAQGYYTGSNPLILPSVPGLASSQTVPAYNPTADVFYSRSSSSTVNVVDRQTGMLSSTISLNLAAAGNPSVPTYSIGYTGVNGYELVLASNSTDAALLFDLNGAFQASVPLGYDVNTSYSGNYANDLFWTIDNAGGYVWRGYEIFDQATVEITEGGFHPVPPVPANNSDVGVVLGQLQLDAVGSNVQLTSVELQASGSGDDAVGVALVSLVREDPGTVNGVVDGLDAVIATGTYAADDGTATLTLGAPLDVVVGTPESVLVLYDFGPNATGGSPPATYDWQVSAAAGSAGVSFPSGNPSGGALVDVRCPLTACGDCDSDGFTTILDALLAAQHGALIIALTGVEFSNCNVTGAVEPDPGAVVDVLDALMLAQEAALLAVTLSCCVP